MASPSRFRGFKLVGMTAIWILAGIGYVVAIAAMMRSMAALGLPDRTEFDRAVHFRRLPEFAPDAADSTGATDAMGSDPAPPIPWAPPRSAHRFRPGCRRPHLHRARCSQPRKDPRSSVRAPARAGWRGSFRRGSAGVGAVRQNGWMASFSFGLRGGRERKVGLSFQRELLGFVAGATALSLLTYVFVRDRVGVHSSTALALYLLAVVSVAAIGGHKPAIVAAFVAPLLTNWFLLEPVHTWRIHDRQDVISLVAFVAVAIIVSNFVAEAARRAREAEDARQEAEVLATLAGSGGADPLQAIAEHLQQSFGLENVSVLRVSSASDDDDNDNGGSHPDGAAELIPVPPFVVEATSGAEPISDLRLATFHTDLDDGVILALRGRPLTDDDQRVLRAFTEQLSKALLQSRLAKAAARAELLDQADALRTAILQAVSHDLRTPLASIKASVSSLRDPDIIWPDHLRDEFLETIEDETDRLSAIVTNLLDLSRLQAGVLRPSIKPVALEEVVPAALYSLGSQSVGVDLDLPDDLVEVATDQALMERVVANLIRNALSFSPEGARVSVNAADAGDSVELRIVDHGPGIRSEHKAVVLQPFHRLGDGVASGGLGLGLAIADGLTKAMGSQLELLDTPKGGLTVMVRIPTVRVA